MPKAKHNRDRSEVFRQMQEASVSAKEAGDCGVKACAIAVGVDYYTALEKLTMLGRKPRQGTRHEIIKKFLALYGMKAEPTPIDSFIAAYPKPHNNLKSVTTHHPVRFAKHWPDGTYLLFSSRHVSAIVDGVNHDWSEGRALRALYIWRVVPK